MTRVKRTALITKFTDGKWNDGDFGGRTVKGGTAFICEWDTISR